MKKNLILSIGVMLLLILLITGCQKGTESSGESAAVGGSSTPVESVEDAKMTEEVDAMVMENEYDSSGIINDYLDKIEQLLEEEGFTFEKRFVYNPADVEKFGASQACSFKVNSQGFEIYLFDTESRNETTMENLKTANESGFITMFGIEFGVNNEVPKPKCVINGNLVLIFPSEDYGIPYPDKEKIIEVFMKL